MWTNYINTQGRSSSYGSWIYNYLCNQCLSPLKLWRSNSSHRKVYSIQLYVIKFVSDVWQISGFLHKYNWNFVESGVKNHNTSPHWYVFRFVLKAVLHYDQELLHQISPITMKFYSTWKYHRRISPITSLSALSYQIGKPNNLKVFGRRQTNRSKRLN